MLPQAGGYYVYARRAFGDTAGFAVGWSDWLTYCAVLGYVSIGIGEFSAVLFPSLAGFVQADRHRVARRLRRAAVDRPARQQPLPGMDDGDQVRRVPRARRRVPGARAGPRRGGGRGRAASTMTLAGVVVALQSVVITYGGWQSALYFTEEDRDPVRNLPRSMIGGEVLVIVIYLLVNVALLAVLSVPAMAGSTLAAADAARAIAGERGGEIITVLSLLSLPPLLNAIMMIGTRILFAMGRDRLIWSRTAEVNAGGTPGVATLVTTAVAVALIATGTFQRLVAMTSFFLVANYGVCCLALVVLRRREPDLARPFRTWGYPWSVAIVLAGAVAFLVGVLAGDTTNGVAALILVGVGVAGHAVAARRAGGGAVSRSAT